MKLLRVGEKNQEKPAILDKDGNLRDISEGPGKSNNRNIS